jgi:hypothetical protein
MPALRTLSARPELLVDDHGQAFPDPATTTIPGVAGPLGRVRLVTALPTNKSLGPVQLEPWRMLVDDRGGILADPAGNVIGTPALWIHRYVSATVARDTRRL